ncbi:MAG: SGNH/GDSL hydrolase family protein [Planctomycetes bacterium]|nr:SGNH/GDSL hydrolase family protein [Planctomycetota bacterium]
MSTPPAARAKRWQKPLLALSIVVLGLLALEAAARVRMLWKYGRADTELYRSEFDPQARITAPVPNQDAGFIHINAQGFRGPDLIEPKPAGALRIAFLGGSTTFCAETRSDEATWPAQVCRLLEEQTPGIRFEYINAGLPALRAADSQRYLEARVARCQPDVIVIYHATNDMSRDTRDLAGQQGLFTGDGGRQSALARLSVAWDLVEKNLRVKARQRASGGAADRLRFDPEELARGFQGALESLIRSAEERAELVAVLTFSIRLRSEQTPEEQLEACSTSLFYMPYMDVGRLAAGFAAYNGAIRAATAATGALLIDGEDEIPGDAVHFNDSVHLTDAGCRAMAERVARRLLADERFLSLIEARR